ncbi:MAG: LamG-like jellyroll fold domain-containing protein, partial [Planctomycetota bacterium]
MRNYVSFLFVFCAAVSNVALAQSAADCPADAIAVWPLDETATGTYADVLGNHPGACVAVCPTPGLAGQVNLSQSFNGVDSAISVPYHVDFDWTGSDSFSIEAWVRTTSTNLQVVAGKYTPTEYALIGLGLTTPGAASLDFRDAGGMRVALDGGVSIADDAWHQILAVRDASDGSVQLYVDGVLADSSAAGALTGDITTPGVDFNIGWLDVGSGFHFNGRVDEVSVRSSALSAADASDRHLVGMSGFSICQGNLAPAFTSTAPTSARVGQPYNYDAEAFGLPTPTFSLNNPIAGLSIDPTTGVITWTPSAGQIGTQMIEIVATNSEGSDTQNVTVVVQAPLACDPSVIEHWTFDELVGTSLA